LDFKEVFFFHSAMASHGNCPSFLHSAASSALFKPFPLFAVENLGQTLSNSPSTPDFFSFQVAPQNCEDVTSPPLKVECSDATPLPIHAYLLSLVKRLLPCRSSISKISYASCFFNDEGSVCLSTMKGVTPGSSRTDDHFLLLKRSPL